jgi:hypothetical protein
MVEGANTLELLDANTRVTKTKYRLGWPSRWVEAYAILYLLDGAVVLEMP